ncbi:MAG: hypothetical protein QF570_18465 [Myxococcota bacterium]|jgi:hypothetical protein|nr:hypothetical protein [Myxococcota bacterium]
MTFAKPVSEFTTHTRGRAVAPPGRAARLLVLGLLASGLGGCAPTQMIALAAAPEPVVLYVDGERLDAVPATLELKATRDHTLFFQREGYQPQLIVVRTRERDGEPHLEPAHVEVRLKRIATSGPDITVEVDVGAGGDEPPER